ncbi:MAG: cytoplasmic protein [Euzebya sp.]
MHLNDEHAKRVAQLPEEIRLAHVSSAGHRSEILASDQCGCFHCSRTFPPDHIVEWVDDDQTALCPECGVDSVIGDQAGFPLTASFLQKMNAHWFSNS